MSHPAHSGSPLRASSLDSIGRWLAVIAQPVRMRLIDTLDREGESTVSTLAAKTGVSFHAASRHLLALRKADVVRRRRAGLAACYELVDRVPLDIYAMVVARSRQTQIPGRHERPK